MFDPNLYDPDIYIDSDGDFYFVFDGTTYRLYSLSDRIVITEVEYNITSQFIAKEELVPVHGHLMNHLLLIARGLISGGANIEQIDKVLCDFLDNLPED